MCSWIAAPIDHRIVQVKVSTTMLVISASRGLPQGDGLSPLLWSFVADCLLRFKTSHAFAQTLYIALPIKVFFVWGGVLHGRS